jgi:hypothetical protein
MPASRSAVRWLRKATRRGRQKARAHRARLLLCNPSLTPSAAKQKLTSGVKTQGRHTCYRLERFQVRECTGEIAGGYDDARRADLTTTTSETTIRLLVGMLRVIL